jgi:flagellar biogenesis protein FliO
MRFRSERGGVVLDLVVAFAFVLLLAFALSRLGVSFSELLHAARTFFGH